MVAERQRSDVGAITRRARSDALPEHTRYVDTGCDVHHSCLSCPLVRCRYDEPGGARRLFSEGRDRSIVALRRAGVDFEEIASRFGVSRRTVFRALARGRQSTADGKRISGLPRTGGRGVGSLAPLEQVAARRRHDYSGC
jgi:hypothetical protein